MRNCLVGVKEVWDLVCECKSVLIPLNSASASHGHFITRLVLNRVVKVSKAGSESSFPFTMQSSLSHRQACDPSY